MKQSIPSCCACGKQGHSALTGPPPWRPYVCPCAPNPYWWGETGTRLETGCCSACGWANFAYANGAHISRDGIRGYRCRNPQCGVIKPETPPCDEHGNPKELPR